MCFYFSIAVDLFFGLKFLDVSHIYGKRFCRLNQVSAAYQKDKTCSPQGNHKRVQWRLAIVPRKRGMQEHSRVNVVAFFVKKKQATRRNVGFLHHSSVWNGMVLYKRADMDLSWCLWSCLLRCALLVAWRKGVASAQRSSFSSGEGKVGASKGGGGFLLFTMGGCDA